MSPDINYWAVLVAGFIPMIVGALWYGPLFGKKWMDLMGKTEEELKAGFNPMKSYGVTFVFALVMAYVMVHFLAAFEYFGVDGAMAGIETGFWIWLGFVLTIGWQSVAFEGQNMTVWILNSLYNLVTLVAMGALLAAWS